MLSHEMKVKTADTLARICTASTLKFLEGKQTQSQTTEGKTLASTPVFDLVRELRNGLQHDLRNLDHVQTLANLDAEYQAVLDEIKLLTIEQRELEKLASRQNKPTPEQRATIDRRYWDVTLELDELTDRKHDIASRLASLRKVMDYATTDALDLYQTAYLAIWEAFQTDALKKTFDNLNDTDTTEAILSAISDVVAFSIPYKTKDGAKDYTAKHWGDRAVQHVINRNRSGVARKTTYIITGYDEDGNELTEKLDTFQTLGGVDSLEQLDNFTELWQALNLSEYEKRIVSHLLKGHTHEQIATACGVSRTAITNKISRLRDRLASIPEVDTYLKK